MEMEKNGSLLRPIFIPPFLCSFEVLMRIFVCQSRGESRIIKFVLQNGTKIFLLLDFSSA